MAYTRDACFADLQSLYFFAGYPSVVTLTKATLDLAAGTPFGNSADISATPSAAASTPSKGGSLSKGGKDAAIAVPTIVGALLAACRRSFQTVTCSFCSFHAFLNCAHVTLHSEMLPHAMLHSMQLCGTQPVVQLLSPTCPNGVCCHLGNCKKCSRQLTAGPSLSS